IDDRGRLWSHPCGFYGEGKQLTDGEAPSVALVRRELGIDDVPSISRSAVAGAIQKRLEQKAFSARADRRSPGFVVPVYGRRDEAEARNSVCTWTCALLTHLAGWLRDDPETARRIVPRTIPDAAERIRDAAVVA